MISGFLTTESPLRKVFPSGIVPLSLPSTRRGKTDASQEPEDFYFIRLDACTFDQKRGMAELMASMGQWSVDEALAVLQPPNIEIPIRAINISGIGMPLRMFI